LTLGSSDPAHYNGEVIVAGSVARVTEISAKSDTSFEDAVKIGLERANSSLRGVTSAWIKEQSVEVTDGQVSGYRVNMLITFILE
jgi:flavin-binding protein dodecin